MAVRRLVRAPAFSLSIIGTLTIGLGAFAVVFTVVDKVLIEPLPYQRPGDLYFVWRDYRAFFDLDRGWLGGPDVAALDSAGGPIAAAVGLRRDRRTLADSSAGDHDPEEVAVMIATPNLFSVLGVNPVLGRGFGPDEVGPDRPGVVVLGYDLWRRRFGRPDGPRPEHPAERRPLYRHRRHRPELPFRPSQQSRTTPRPPTSTSPSTTGWRNAAGSGAFAGLVRARPGATAEQFAAAVGAVGRSLDGQYFRGRGLKLYPVSVEQDLVAAVRPACTVLGLSAVFLLLVLAVNLATLLLARAVQREREFAVSRALGANLALVRATLTEAGLLAWPGPPVRSSSRSGEPGRWWRSLPPISRAERRSRSIGESRPS